MAGLAADVKRRQHKIEELEKAVYNEKVETKQKERTVQSFVNMVHDTVQQKGNEEAYIECLKVIYETFVKKYSGDILEKKKKDPETIEELDR